MECKKLQNVSSILWHTSKYNGLGLDLDWIGCLISCWLDFEIAVEANESELAGVEFKQPKCLEKSCIGHQK